MERTLLSTRAAMRRALPVIALVLAAAPSGAAAQMTALVQPFGGRTGSPIGLQDVAGQQPIGRAECEADTPIPVQLTMVPQQTSGVTNTVVDVFSALSSATAMCETPANRTASGSSDPICLHADDAAVNIEGRATFTMELVPSVIFATDDMPDPCAASTAMTRTFYLFPAVGQNDIMTTFAAGSYATVLVTLDPVAPSAPVLDGPVAAGDASIDVTFDAPTSQIYEARLYLDPAGCPDGMTPSSTTLVAGSAPSGTAVATNTSQMPVAVEASGASLGLDYGESAAVGVTFVDRARNESVLSNVICVTRVQVPGFWDSYCMERGLGTEECSQRYASCAATPGTAAGLPIFLVGLALVALGRRRAR